MDKEHSKPDKDEIDKKLKEINLTVLASERKKKQVWFKEQHIRIITFETQTFLFPEHVDEKEFLQRFEEINAFLSLFVEKLQWFSTNNIKIQKEKDRFVFLGIKDGNKNNDIR